MSSKGTIKKFFTDKGFGFITPDDGSEDVFVHVKENGGDDAWSNVQAGDAVKYDAEWDDRKGKYKAANVTGDTIGGGGGGGGSWGSSGGGGGGGGDRYAPW
mmetsp:Transcript_113270/g.178164  ORF Transcript_113270/g.178164 Transcript_113270/m.178164 type:complete len:101 (-) Transcript_113270:244-546(-)